MNEVLKKDKTCQKTILLVKHFLSKFNMIYCLKKLSITRLTKTAGSSMLVNILLKIVILNLTICKEISREWWFIINKCEYLKKIYLHQQTIGKQIYRYKYLQYTQII